MKINVGDIIYGILYDPFKNEYFVSAVKVETIGFALKMSDEVGGKIFLSREEAENKVKRLNFGK